MTYLHACRYVGQVLEKDFSNAYKRFGQAGVLHYELTNIVELCSPLMKGLDDADPFLRQEITLVISNYLLD